MKIIKDWHPVDPGRFVLDVDHGLIDDKGRAIGGRAIIDDRLSLNPPDSQRFELEIRTLRAGRQFGAVRPSSYFETEFHAKAEAAKRLARQGKGFAKLYGGKP